MKKDPRSGFESIRAEDEYAGTRVTLPARCGAARLTLQIDMGLGDSVWPPPQLHAYPALLEFPPPMVLAYQPEAVVAEKLEATIVLGDRNNRIKDFFDLQHLASRFEFDRATLAEAVRQAFVRRRTPVPSEESIGLTPAYWENVPRGPQTRAFSRRAGLTVGPEAGTDILSAIRPFLLPILDDLRSGIARRGAWPPGGPWGSQEEVTRGRRTRSGRRVRT